MWLGLLKTLTAAGVISFCSWLSGKKPELAGFIIALPLTSLLVLAFSYVEYSNPEASIRFAKSILLAIPLSCLFFIPFLLADKWHVSFWVTYAAGIALLVVGYFMHRALLG